MMTVISMLEDIKQTLGLLSNGVAKSNDFLPPHHLTIKLCNVRLDRINAIYIHDMWCATCPMHPG